MQFRITFCNFAENWLLVKWQKQGLFLCRKIILVEKNIWSVNSFEFKLNEFKKNRASNVRFDLLSLFPLGDRQNGSYVALLGEWRRFYEQFTGLYFQPCKYQSLVVSRVVIFTPIPVVFTQDYKILQLTNSDLIKLVCYPFIGLTSDVKLFSRHRYLSEAGTTQFSNS